MSLINKFLSLKNWQKLSIGIAIAIIFKVFLMNDFIVNVNALTTNSNNPQFALVNPEYDLPEKIDLNEKLPYKSNFVSQERLNQMGTSGQRPYDFKVYYDSIQNSDNSLVDRLNSNGNLLENSQFNFIDYLPYTYYVTGFDFDGSNQLRAGSIPDIRPLHRGHRYTFLFEFYQNNSFYSNGISYDTEDFDIGMRFCWNTTDTSHQCDNLQNYIDNLEIEYITPSDITFTNEHYAYVKITFETNELFPADLDYGFEYSLQYITLRLKNPDIQNAGDIIDPDTFKYFVASNDGGIFKVKQLFMIEDYRIEMYDGDDYFGILGNNLNQTKYETCEPLDLNCHVRNIVTGIKSFTNNIIASIYRLFAYAFIPDTNDLKNIISNTKENIFSHFPDLQAFFDYVEYFFQRLTNIERQTTVSFPGVKVPGYNNWLIAPFTFDFNTILSDTSTPIYYIYITARIVTSCVVTLLWCIFVYRGVKKILGVGGSDL